MKLFPSNGLLGMCRWIGLHFHDSTDYNGIIFSSIFNRVTRLGSNFFGGFESKKIISPKVTKMGSIISHEIDYNVGHFTLEFSPATLSMLEMQTESMENNFLTTSNWGKGVYFFQHSCPWLSKENNNYCAMGPFK